MASVLAVVTRATLQRASLHTRATMPLAMAKRPVMEQVEVDDPLVQQQLGKIQVIGLVYLYSLVSGYFQMTRL